MGKDIKDILDDYDKVEKGAAKDINLLESTEHSLYDPYLKEKIRTLTEQTKRQLEASKIYTKNMREIQRADKSHKMKREKTRK